MSPPPGHRSHFIAGRVGGAGGIAADGFVHGTLPFGNAWLRAAETGLSGAVVGGLLGRFVVGLGSRRSK